MRIALVATPFTDHNLQLASQIGVTDIVIRYPGCRLGTIEPLCQQVMRHGMKISVVEGYLPIEKVVLGRDGYRAQPEELAQLVRSMGALGVGMLCYNWMGLTDWTRTSFGTPGRGGALCSEFDLAQTEAAGSMEGGVSATALWENLERFWAHPARCRSLRRSAGDASRRPSAVSTARVGAHHDRRGGL